MAAIACPICRREAVEFREAFGKRLSREDIEGSHGVYIPMNDAARLCGRQLANENEVSEVDLLFYDVQKNPWVMRLRRSGRKYFLTGKWRQLVRAKNLSKGRTVTFYTLWCPSCAENKGYMIGVVQLFGQPIA